MVSSFLDKYNKNLIPLEFGAISIISSPSEDWPEKKCVWISVVASCKYRVKVKKQVKAGLVSDTFKGSEGVPSKEIATSVTETMPLLNQLVFDPKEFLVFSILP